MTTISVPINGKLEAAIENLIESGYGENKAEVVRKAIAKASDDEAVNIVLKSMQEPTLSGDLKDLTKKIK